MEQSKIVIYLNAFWPGFYEKTDANHIDFIEYLLSFPSDKETKQIRLSRDPFESNVLVECWFGPSVVHLNHWKYRIFLNWEAQVPHGCRPRDFRPYNMMYTMGQGGFASFWYLHQDRNTFIQTNLPVEEKRFCAIVISNGQECFRTRFIRKLIQNCGSDKITFLGRFMKNSDELDGIKYWDEEYPKILSRFKFVVCFENVITKGYITEKLLNAYCAETIPVYSGSEHLSSRYFDSNGYVFVKDDGDIDRAINEMMILDKNSEMYDKKLKSKTPPKTNLIQHDINISRFLLFSQILNDVTIQSTDLPTWIIGSTTNKIDFELKLGYAFYDAINNTSIRIAFEEILESKDFLQYVRIIINNRQMVIELSTIKNYLEDAEQMENFIEQINK